MKVKQLNRDISTSLLFFFALFLFFGELEAQVFNSKQDKSSASENIQLLKEGTLIVPLWIRQKKLDVLDEMIAAGGLSDKQRSLLEKRRQNEWMQQKEFNASLIQHFSEQYNFSKVLFVEDKQLHDFDPSNTIFVHPVTMKGDPEIHFEGEDYFFLRYYQNSGVANSPSDVRFFRLADKNMELLSSSFPISPDRKTAYRLRLRDLINMSPEINDLVNILVTKLNNNLQRYHDR